MTRANSKAIFLTAQQRSYRARPENDGSILDVWSASDRITLARLADRLKRRLPSSTACWNIKGQGGIKGCLRHVFARLSAKKEWYVYKTDVKSYYASIDHDIMLDKLEPYLDRDDLNLCARFLRRSTEYGGVFIDFYQGISPGSPVSVVLGSFFLHGLDDIMLRRHAGVHYYRFMDDILVLAPTRWQLKRAIATINSTFSAHKLQCHPDKTKIGRYGRGLFARGIEFLGFIVSQAGLALSATTCQRHQAILSRLYEQSQRPRNPRFGGHPKAKIDWAQAEADTIAYHKRFLTWATKGFSNVPVICPAISAGLRL